MSGDKIRKSPSSSATLFKEGTKKHARDGRYETKSGQKDQMSHSKQGLIELHITKDKTETQLLRLHQKLNILRNDDFGHIEVISRPRSPTANRREAAPSPGRGTSSPNYQQQYQKLLPRVDIA